MHNIVPEISLISSWYIPGPDAQIPDQPHKPGETAARHGVFAPPALTNALANGISLFDLYFLNDTDLAWYAKQCDGTPAENVPNRVLHFVAGLEKEDLDRIAPALTKLMADHYRGRLVGPRPRICALTTYWPLISYEERVLTAGHFAPPRTPEEAAGIEQEIEKSKTEAENAGEARRLSVRALQSSLYLAGQLGCRHVEIVCGIGLGKSAGQDDAGLDETEDDARARRMAVLARSLYEVYTDARALELFGGMEPADVPAVCVEAEPGATFLIRNVQDYVELRRVLSGAGGGEPVVGTPPAATGGESPRTISVIDKILLNIDIAHMFLVPPLPPLPDGTPAEAQSPEQQLNLIETRGLKHLIGHFHVSDHARSHAADLLPGVYHFYDHYEDWFALAAELASNPVDYPDYSGVMAIELEGCADLDLAKRAISRTRQWLVKAARDAPDKKNRKKGHEPDLKKALPLRHLDSAAVHRQAKGVLLVVDIANSTNYLGAGGFEIEVSAKYIDKAVSAMCHQVHLHGGSAYSFTGDGVVAFFEFSHFLTPEKCVREALSAGRSMYQEMCKAIGKKNPPLGLRLAIHSGQVAIPVEGPLLHQIIGGNVIIACRLCSWVGRAAEERHALHHAGGHPPAQENHEPVFKSALCISEGAFNILGDSMTAWTAVAPDELVTELKGISRRAVEDHVGNVYWRSDS